MITEIKHQRTTLTDEDAQIWMRLMDQDSSLDVYWRVDTADALQMLMLVDATEDKKWIWFYGR